MEGAQLALLEPETAEKVTKELTPLVNAANPQPFVGDCPAGIRYVLDPKDLPDPGFLPKALAFDLETFNRRTDQWRHVASLFPQLGGEIRLGPGL